jgi:hypothetical protein
MKRRQFITLVGGVAVGGARGRLIACGGSASSGPSTKTIRSESPLAPRSCSGLRSWIGQRAGICGGIEWFDFASGL